ncbi:hypothetical protein EDD16DRAFT_1621397 [Pisolithus croceorrhizus]|nr:hypothetical protein EDD16DRAFT_1621397 [Pisolithus croceorrhizus]
MSASTAEGFQGPFLIGLAINIFLHGPRHHAGVLVFHSIAILYLADTFNCIVSIYYIYNSLIIHFGDEANLLRGNWGSASTVRHLFP